jgi:hypothetical protein
MMMRRLQFTFLCLLLACSSLAYAREQSTKGTSDEGYSYTVQVPNDTLYVYPTVKPAPGSDVAERYPASTPVTVRVADAQGNPVNGVFVAFKVEPNSMLKGMLTISPQDATTKDGEVRATIQPSDSATTGEGHVIVQVGNKTKEILLTLQEAPMLPN